MSQSFDEAVFKDMSDCLDEMGAYNNDEESSSYSESDDTST